MDLVTQKWPILTTYMTAWMGSFGTDVPSVLLEQTSAKSCFFGQLHRRFREAGTFKVRSEAGLERTTRTPVVEDIKLWEFYRDLQKIFDEADTF